MLKFNALILTLILSTGLFSQGIDMRDEAIEARIKPLANACMQGEDCGIASSGPGYKVSLIKTSTSTEPAASGSDNEHIVQMLNAGSDGVMVFEPAALKIKKGDTVVFKSVDPGHNTASAPNLIPAGASSWESTQGQDFSITFDTEGVYVYQCTPHLVMAMVGLIQVGEATNMAEIKSNLGGFEALIALNQDRLGKYFSQLESL
jgi:pseudoazurin